MLSFIKRLDIFGHPIALTFNKKESTHKTFIGGFLSLLTSFFIMIYFFILVKKMYTFDDNKNYTYNMLEENFGYNISLSDTNVKIILQLLDVNTMTRIKNVEEIQKYVRF